METILIVDNQPALLRFMEQTLSREGYRVLLVQDALSAISLLRTERPSVIFVDLIMPYIDGEQLCRILKRMPGLAESRVVILSAVAAEHEVDLPSLGAVACIAKGPFAKMGENVVAVARELTEGSGRLQQPILRGMDDIRPRGIIRELLQSKRHMGAILESIEEGILEVMPDGTVVFANHASSTIFGSSKEMLLGQPLDEQFPEADRRELRKKLHPDPDTGEPERIGPLTTSSGRQVWMRLVSVVNDAAHSAIVIVDDISEHKRLQAQLQHAQKMEAIGTLTSGVAHNFRNILTGISVNNQLMRIRFEDDPRLLDIARRNESYVHRGTQLVSELMKFSHRQTTRFGSVDLAEIVRDTYQLVSKSFDKKIQLEMDLTDSLPVVGHPSGLSQVMINLCTNARDAMPEGGTLRIAAGREGRHVRVAVSDTGMGMSPEIRDKCFDPFFTTKDVTEGTGLGLSTTYGIVKDHGGQIRVCSEPGRGSTFELTLPLASAGAVDTEEHRREVLRGNGEKILVVDDEKEMLESVRELLESLGYRAATASTGQAALAEYRYWKPDVVLLDRNMPEMDGIACARKIVAADPSAKIVMVSGYEAAGPHGIDEPAARLIEGYLTKPLDVIEMSILLARLSGEKRFDR